MADQPEKHWRFRPRYSLLNMLFVMTIVAMAIVIVQFWRELVPLRAEVRKLHDEVGKLSIDDVTKACAIRLLSLNESTWKYRIYVPPGQRYGLGFTVNNVPHQGLPSILRPSPNGGRFENILLKNGYYKFLGEGEHEITVGVARNEEGVRCVGLEWYDAFTGVRRMSKSVDVEATHWPRKDTGGFEGGVDRWTRAVDRSTQCVDARGELILIRYVVPRLGSPMDRNPTDGFLLWIEPIRASGGANASSGADPIGRD
jgi:hypothetical protein